MAVLNQPKFSVITISFNHAEFIRTNIDSVLAQNYPNFEHIVIDGGSNDGTIEILKSYPHLAWISESDRGISNALNKGFKRATGDIIAWINSDDWYEPGTFAVVAQSLKHNSVVLGNATETDRIGTPVKQVKNNPRSYYDLLRYWIPNGWLAQPAVFFTKEAIDSVRLSNGDYVDESFHYSMDYDVWLRLGSKYPFTNYVNKTFAHYRVYGENKTGRVFASPQRELGRAFRRSIKKKIETERKLTFILPVQELGPGLPATVDSILNQTIKDFDLIIVDHSTDSDTKQMLQLAVDDFEETSTVTNFRLIKSKDISVYEARKIGIKASSSELSAVLRPGDILPADFMQHAINVFAHDAYGAGIILPSDHPQRMILGTSPTGLMQANQLINLNEEFLPFVVRNIVIDELGGFTQGAANWTSLHTFLLRMMNRGWLIKADCELVMDQLCPVSPEQQKLSELRLFFLKSYLYSLGATDIAADSFYSIRSESPYAPRYVPDQVASAEEMLLGLPADWMEIDFTSSLEAVERFTEKFPYFQPAWYVRIHLLKKAQRDDEAQALIQQLKSKHLDFAKNFQ